MPSSGSSPLIVAPAKTTSCVCPARSMRICGASEKRKLPAPPDNAAIALTKRHDRLPRPTDRADDGLFVGDRATAIAGLDTSPNQQRRCIEVLDQIVRPEHLARAYIERKKLFVGADRKDTITNQQRCRVGSGTKAEVLMPRGIRMLPERRARAGIHRDDGLFLGPRAILATAIAGPIKGEQPFVTGDDRGVTDTERPAPDHRWSGSRPAVCETGGIDDEVAMRPTPTGAMQPVSG